MVLFVRLELSIPDQVETLTHPWHLFSFAVDPNNSRTQQILTDYLR